MISIFTAGLPRWWRGIGWLGLALLIGLSLMPGPPSLTMEQGDKLGHLLAYATLMYWWAQLHVTAHSRIRLVAGLVALGIALEYVQGWTGWRSFDPIDMLANTAGVALGWMVAAISPNLLALADRYLIRQG